MKRNSSSLEIAHRMETSLLKHPEFAAFPASHCRFAICLKKKTFSEQPPRWLSGSAGGQKPASPLCTLRRYITTFLSANPCSVLLQGVPSWNRVAHAQFSGRLCLTARSNVFPL